MIDDSETTTDESNDGPTHRGATDGPNRHAPTDSLDAGVSHLPGPSRVASSGPRSATEVTA